ncbi:MAG: DUF4129 domain-containing protein [Pirellulaceae bacterium]|nr:DUF4129 domain-containing protein [Pirellulaceae bacterium]
MWRLMDFFKFAWLINGLIIAALALAWPAGASGLEPAPSVEAGRKALSARSKYPWYDAQEDGLRRIDVRTPRESAKNRGSMWQATPTKPSDYSWLEYLVKGLGVALRWLIWIGLGLLLVGLIVLLARGLVLREEQTAVAVDEAEAVSTKIEADRIDSLPFQIARPPADLLAEAKACYERGDTSQAMIYLFSYKLLALDRQDLIRLARGKTNRQYVAELSQQPTLQELLRRSMVAFEDVFFGRHRLDPERFEGCWRSLESFHQHLQQLAAS